MAWEGHKSRAYRPVRGILLIEACLGPVPRFQNRLGRAQREEFSLRKAAVPFRRGLSVAWNGLFDRLCY